MPSLPRMLLAITLSKVAFALESAASVVWRYQRRVIMESWRIDTAPNGQPTDTRNHTQFRS